MKCHEYKKGDIVFLKNLYQNDEDPYSYPAGTKGNFLQYDTDDVGYVLIKNHTIAVQINNLSITIQNQ